MEWNIIFCNEIKMYSPKWPAKIPPFFIPHLLNRCFYKDLFSVSFPAICFRKHLEHYPEICIMCKTTGTNLVSIRAFLCCPVPVLCKYCSKALLVPTLHPCSIYFIIYMRQFAWLNIHFICQKCLSCGYKTGLLRSSSGPSCL